MRYHVHGIVRAEPTGDNEVGDEVAEITVTVEAENDEEAQFAAWSIFDGGRYMDIEEIEEAEEA